MTRLFNRKDKTTIAELEEYYSSTGKKNRKGMAWLMAFLSILITVIVVVALFFLVRWIYRAVTDDNSSTTTVSETDNESINLPNFDGDIVGQGNQTESSSNSVEEGGVVSDEAASVSVDETQGSTANSTNSSTNENSVAGVTTVPDTGAGEMIVLIPIATGIAGYFISRKYLLNQK